MYYQILELLVICTIKIVLINDKRQLQLPLLKFDITHYFYNRAPPNKIYGSLIQRCGMDLFS